MSNIYIYIFFFQNVKYKEDSDPVLTLSSHLISVIALFTHLSLIAVVITTHHYYGAGYGDVLGKCIPYFCRWAKKSC